MSGDRATLNESIPISPVMLDAGERVILEELGGVDAIFCSRDLAARVFEAMASSLGGLRDLKQRNNREALEPRPGTTEIR